MNRRELFRLGRVLLKARALVQDEIGRRRLVDAGVRLERAIDAYRCRLADAACKAGLPGLSAVWPKCDATKNEVTP